MALFGGHHAHQGHGAGSVASALWLVLLGGGVAFYLYGVLRERRRGRQWSAWRSAGFLTGSALVAAAVTGPLAERGHEDLRWHMAQHLMIGMLAPLGLMLAAPVTLALRTLPRGSAGKLARLIGSRPLHGLSHPFTAAVLNVGGMYLLYMTPLYGAMADSAALHQLVHVHFLLAGCLFTGSIAGPDFAPTRASPEIRLTALFLSMATHATLGKLMYAYGWPRGTAHGVSEIQQAAQWMYYGGDLAEVLLACALFASWPRTAAPRVRAMTEG